MDVCRTLLVAGLAVLLWKARFRGIRPVRDFVLWGANYPFHFSLISLLILVIWGVLGADFGLQGLFLENRAPTQVLLGAAVMLLFAALILHYSVLDTPGRWWNNSLKTLVSVLRDLNALMPADYPVQRMLPNGFLERFDRREIAVIHALVHHGGGGSAAARAELESDGGLIAMLREEPFRLLVAPAILLIKGLMLVFLAGVMPAVVIPLFGRDTTALVERLPWLVGVALGDLLGIVLACATTRWAARAADWAPFEERLLAAVRALTDANTEAGPPTGPAAAPSETQASDPRWVSWLFAFFVVHFVVTLALPQSLTARWIDWPERTYIDVPGHGAAPARWEAFPWLPVGVLLVEGLAAVVLLAAARRLPRVPFVATAGAVLGRAGTAARARTRVALEALSSLTVRRVVVGSVLVLAVVGVAVALLASPDVAQSLRQGLRALVFLGSFLGLWIFAFHSATTASAAAERPRVGLLMVQGVALALLVLVYLAGATGWLVVALASALVASVFANRRGVGGMLVGAVLLAAPGAALLALVPAASAAAVAAVWLGSALLVVGASNLCGVARRRPALLYPLTLLLAFTAFAVPYNTLDTRWQSAMPAAGSIACMVGLLAAAYTIVAFFRPKGTVMVAAAVVATVIVLNGNAWFVDPNQFKTTFPNMQAYYALPVYLNSRDYFRDTTPSAVRLRGRALTGDIDRLERQGASERLATAYFRLLGQRARTGGGHVLRLSVEDPHGRLRAGGGDEVRLASEEWFTTLLDGPDCVALAEEPFYRKIYRWFRYEKAQMIRDGIIRGPSYPLRPAAEIAHYAGGGSSAVRYELLTGPGDRLGLRLRGLASDYRKHDAQYLLIAMYWSGRVAAVRHTSHLDAYEVEFEIPPGHEPLDESQTRVMSAWLERCHLDAMRPVAKVATDVVRNAGASGPPALPEALPGDCLVLEDARAEAPIPVGVYLAGAGDRGAWSPAFAPYWPTRENLARTMAETPSPVARPSAAFTLRPAHDRGIFASQGVVAAQGDRRSVQVALYNARRVRPGDRLVFSWNGQGHAPAPGEVRHGATFEVEDIAEPKSARGPGNPLPPGFRWATLLPVAVSGARESAGLDLFVGEWQLLQPLNNNEVLLSWKRLVGGLWPQGKPKLVIVTVSGGGIRASVWTSVVLRKLERTLGAEFPYHIRLITGASGGMIGGSYYAASLGPPPADVLRGGQADFAALHGTSAGEFVDRMATNQLDAVAGRMVFADLISPFNPFLQKGDRGRTLEQTWVRWTGGAGQSPLDRALQSYAADERHGWRPSMVYTPMMVEDGRRLLVSNLDLAFATRNVGGLLIEPSSRKIDRPAFQSEDLDREIHDEDDVFSLSAVEFFRLFPEAHDFRITTAMRMSASFPWVSPAVSLPTLPPRRVVDAGYYDNYGVNLAALWLTKMRPWLEANTSGVVIVQIRDYVSQGARTEIDFDRLSGTSALDPLTWHADSELLGPGIQAISTPLLGISNARQWTMSFRNDEQVDLLDLLFDDEKSRDFFRTVVFECPVEVSLNWQLSAREKEVLSSGLGRADADPREELGRTKDYLVGRDSYELHKWRVEHRNDPAYQAELKAKYTEQLHALGIRSTERLTARQCQQMYENIVMNLKRLELLRDWWRTGRE